MPKCTSICAKQDLTKLKIFSYYMAMSDASLSAMLYFQPIISLPAVFGISDHELGWGNSAGEDVCYLILCVSAASVIYSRTRAFSATIHNQYSKGNSVKSSLFHVCCDSPSVSIPGAFAALMKVFAGVVSTWKLGNQWQGVELALGLIITLAPGAFCALFSVIGAKQSFATQELPTSTASNSFGASVYQSFSN